MRGTPVLLLTTTGRRTGAARTVPLMYVRDGDRFIVVGSNFAAPDRDPAWWLNLKAHPVATVQLGKREQRVRARRLEEGAATELWPRLDEANRLWRHTTTVTDRPLPVIALEPTT